MDKIKRLLGLLWMILGPLTFFLLIYSAVENIDAAGTKDINKPLPWMIILIVFAPIAIGFAVFGWYAWKGDYDGEIKT